jgi:hypothetical protein
VELKWRTIKLTAWKKVSLSLVQGPSTATCMMATYPSQLNNWLHQLPTVGIGSLNPLTCVLSFCHKAGSNRKTQPWYWLAPNYRREEHRQKRGKKQRTNKYTQWEEETEKDRQKGKTNKDR